MEQGGRTQARAISQTGAGRAFFVASSFFPTLPNMASAVVMYNPGLIMMEPGLIL